ncbi:MAG: capsule assembly Wzi family protein [Chitinophagaceae bacterium]|nr:capsule assembly Wzi family protein [Chitinophagaceae bacterium]
MKRLVLALPFLFLTFLVSGQDVVSDIYLMDYQRLSQLNDTLNLQGRSFVVRSTDQFWNQLLDESDKKRKWPKVQLTQAVYNWQTNSNLPIGSNDGTMYPSVGLQQRISLGVHAQWNGFSLMLQPEFVTAANTDPIGFQSDTADPNYWARYYLYNVNKIDNFSRFGKEPLQKIFLGQSSFRYNGKSVSIGISTENLWWGPGIKNSLIMTNNAPGFLHTTFNSRKPIATAVGKIEFQVVFGILKNTSTEAPDNEIMRTIWAGGIAKKQKAGRALAGYIFSWNPKWMPNLHIGTAGATYFYKDSTGVTPSDLVLDSENKKGSASLGSLFFRYVMPKEHAEIYFEYGRANKLANPFNIIGDTIPTGYIAGFRKLFRNRSNKSAILFGIEITQLQLPDARLIFNKDAVFGIPRTNSWYTHPYITQGYTNQGKLLGASIGPGSNSEMASVSWIKGLKKIGISAERLVHNNDFYYYNYLSRNLGIGFENKYWVDWNIAFQVQWDYKEFLFSGFINRTSTIDYRWIKLDGGFYGPSTLSDKMNTQVGISISYFFKRNHY